MVALGASGLGGCQLLEGISSKDYEAGTPGASGGAGGSTGGPAPAGGASGTGGAGAAGHGTGGAAHGGAGGAVAGHGGVAGQGGKGIGGAAGAAGSGAGGVSGEGGSAGGAAGPGGGGTSAGGAQGGSAQGGQGGAQAGQGGQAGSQGGEAGTGGMMGANCVPPPTNVDCSTRGTGVTLRVPGTLTTISNSVGIVPAIVTNGAVVAWTEASTFGATYNLNAATLSNPNPKNVATSPTGALAAAAGEIIWSDGKYIQRQSWNNLFGGTAPAQNVQLFDNGLTSTVALFLDDKGFGGDLPGTELAATTQEQARRSTPNQTMTEAVPTPWTDFDDVFAIQQYPDGTLMLAGSKQGLVFFDVQGTPKRLIMPPAGRCLGPLATDVVGFVYVVDQACGTPGEPVLHVYAASPVAGNDAGPFTLESCLAPALLPTHMTLSTTHLYFTTAGSGAIGRMARASLATGSGSVTPEPVLFDDAGCPGASMPPTGPDQLAVANGVLFWSNTQSKHLSAVGGL